MVGPEALLDHRPAIERLRISEPVRVAGYRCETLIGEGAEPADELRPRSVREKPDSRRNSARPPVLQQR